MLRLNADSAADLNTKFSGIGVFIDNDISEEFNYPHFIVMYKGQSALFSIDEPARVQGELPLGISIDILKWARENKNELYKNWYSINKAVQ